MPRNAKSRYIEYCHVSGKRCAKYQPQPVSSPIAIVMPPMMKPGGTTKIMKDAPFAGVLKLQVISIAMRPIEKGSMKRLGRYAR